MPLGWLGIQCQLIKLIVSIVFVLIVAIDSVNCIDHIDNIYRINRINSGIFNCSALQLKDNSNDPTKSGMTFWGKKGGIFEVTGIYWHLQIFHEVCLKKK